MAEEKVPLGPRSNPLYGGSSGNTTHVGGGRTPNWARRSGPSPRHAPFSDVASTPPESPARDFVTHRTTYTTPAFEHPGYTVETPGLSEGAAPAGSPYNPSTYHAPPYYVHTPAQNDLPGASSPFSSAPPSPARYAYGSDSDTRSQRSARVASQTRYAQMAAIYKTEEDEEEYEDPERDRQRLVKEWTCVSWIVLIAIVLGVIIALFVVWSKLRPKGPVYTFVNIRVDKFDTLSPGIDPNGVSTTTIFGNVTAYFTSYNPNSHASINYDKSYVTIGFENLGMLSGEVNATKVFPNVTKSFSMTALSWNYPLYGAGNGLLAAINNTFVNLTVSASLYAHVTVFWKILEPHYSSQLNCTVGINSTTLTVLNSTCGRTVYKTSSTLI